MSPNLEYHIRSERSLLNNVFRYGSSAWGALIREARSEYNAGRLTELYDDDLVTLESDIAEIAVYEDQEVLLEVPVYEFDKNIWVIFVRISNKITRVVLPGYTLPIYNDKQM